MEEDDFESVDSIEKKGSSNKKLSKVNCNLKSNSSEMVDFGNLDKEINSMLNSKIDFSELENTDEFDDNLDKNKKNNTKIEYISQKATISSKKDQNQKKNKTTSADDEAEQRINKIIDEFNEDVKIELGNIKEKSMMEPSLRGKWIRKYVLAKAQEKKLKQSLDVLKEEISKMYASDGSFLSSRQTIDAALKNDSGIKEIKRELYIQSQIVETLSYCKDTIYGFGYSIKNSLEAIKLDMGI